MILAVLAASPLSADEAAREQDREKVIPKPRSSMPWVGLRVGSLDDAMRAHAAMVPEGVGFLVESVAEGGPAEKAGLKRYDVLWKFDEQLLVNKAQFAVLLKNRKPGDGVAVSVVRSGEELELKLELGKPPVEEQEMVIMPAEIPLAPTGIPGIPMVRVTPHDRVAALTRGDGSSARLHYEGDEPFIAISDSEGALIYEGPVKKDGEFAVPKDWKSSTCVMIRSLYKAKQGDASNRRKPRPRVVVPPTRN